MPKCVRIKKKNRKFCVGDMRDEITLENRSINPQDADSIDFIEDFSESNVIDAAIETVRGLETFDGVNVESIVTHKIYIRFIEGVTEETWVKFKGRRLDIMDVENLDERDQFLLLRCKERGADNINVNTI